MTLENKTYSLSQRLKSSWEAACAVTREVSSPATGYAGGGGVVASKDGETMAFALILGVPLGAAVNFFRPGATERFLNPYPDDPKRTPW